MDPTFTFIPRDHVRAVFTLEGEHLDPNDFYKTTGDAVQKAMQLKREILAIINKILALPPNNPNHKRTARAANAALAETDKLVALLIEQRGDAIHFQSEWVDGEVHCFRKDPKEVMNIRSEEKKARKPKVGNEAPIPSNFRRDLQRMHQH